MTVNALIFPKTSFPRQALIWPSLSGWTLPSRIKTSLRCHFCFLKFSKISIQKLGNFSNESLLGGVYIYEIPIAIEVTQASKSEQKVLQGMIEKTYDETPQLAERCTDFTADRGLDSGKIKAMLWDKHKIRPVIDVRKMWREEKGEPDYDPEKPITRSLYPDRADNIVYTEKGTMHCVCPVTGKMRDMVFYGFEAERNSLKYRCPAAAYGLECMGKNNVQQ